MKGSDLVDAVVSKASATKLFEAVNGNQPVNAPGTGLTCAVWVQDIKPVPLGSGLAETTVNVIFNVRLYTSAIQEPYDAIDPNLIDATFALCAAFSGDFTLGGQVMAVDLLGAYGPPMGAQAAYLDQDGQKYRVMTITLPIVIADLWAQTAVTP